MVGRYGGAQEELDSATHGVILSQGLANNTDILWLRAKSSKFE